jgi:hypothetical protein
MKLIKLHRERTRRGKYCTALEEMKLKTKKTPSEKKVKDTIFSVPTDKSDLFIKE